MSGLRPTLAELAKIDVGLDWNILGLRLKVPPEKIEEISRRPDNYETKAIIMFAEWLRISPEASWEHLQDARQNLGSRCISNPAAPERSRTRSSSNFCLVGESRANKELHVDIPEPPHPFHKGVKKLKCTYGLLFDRMESELISAASTNNIDIVPVVKKYLNRCFPELRMNRAKGIEDILQIVESECDVTDITCLTGIVKLLENKAIYIDISDCESNLDSEVESFCQILHNSISDDLSLYKRLVFKSTSEDNAKHIHALLRRAFAHEELEVELQVLKKKKIPVRKGLTLVIGVFFIWKTSKTKRKMPTSDEPVHTVIIDTKESTMTHFDTHAREPSQHLAKKEASNFSCNETVSSNLGPEIESQNNNYSESYQSPLRRDLLFPTATNHSMSDITYYERQHSMSDMNCFTDCLERLPHMTNAPIEVSFPTLTQFSVSDIDCLPKIDNFSEIQPHQTDVQCNLSMDVNGPSTSAICSVVDGPSTSAICSVVDGPSTSTICSVVDGPSTSAICSVGDGLPRIKNYSLGIIGGGSAILGTTAIVVFIVEWILLILLILVICCCIFLIYKISTARRDHLYVHVSTTQNNYSYV